MRAVVGRLSSWPVRPRRCPPRCPCPSIPTRRPSHHRLPHRPRSNRSLKPYLPSHLQHRGNMSVKTSFVFTVCTMRTLLGTPVIHEVFTIISLHWQTIAMIPLFSADTCLLQENSYLKAGFLKNSLLPPPSNTITCTQVGIAHNLVKSSVD